MLADPVGVTLAAVARDLEEAAMVVADLETESTVEAFLAEAAAMALVAEAMALVGVEKAEAKEDEEARLAELEED